MKRCLIILFGMLALAGPAGGWVAHPERPLGEIALQMIPGIGAPEIAWNGRQYLAVANGFQGIVRLDGLGRPIDEPAIPFPDGLRFGQSEVAARSDGTWVLALTSGGIVHLATVSEAAVVTFDRQLEGLGGPISMAASGRLIAVTGSSASGTRLLILEGDDIVSDVILPQPVLEVIGLGGGHFVVLSDTALVLIDDSGNLETIAFPESRLGKDVTARNGEVYVALDAPAGVEIWKQSAGGLMEFATVSRPETKLHWPQIEWVREEILMIWQEWRSVHVYLDEADLWAASIGPASGVSQPEKISEGIYAFGRWGGRRKISIESDGETPIVLWQSGSTAPTLAAHIRTAVLDPDQLRLGKENVVFTSVRSEVLDHIASVEGRTLLVWLEDRFYREPRHAAILDELGQDVARFRLNPNVFDVFPLTDSFGVLERAGDVGYVFYRISLDGELLDPAPIPLMIPNEVTSFDASCSQTLCLLAWLEEVSDQKQSSIRALRISGGSVLDVGGVLVTTSDHPIDLEDVSSDGERFLVVWSEDPHPGGTILHSSIISVEPDWTIRSSQFAAAPRILSGASATWTGSEYLIFWSDWSSDETRLIFEFRGARLTREGHSIDGAEFDWQGWPIWPRPFALVPFGSGLRGLAWTKPGVLSIVDFDPVTRGVEVLYSASPGDVKAAVLLAPDRLLLVRARRLVDRAHFDATRLFVQIIEAGRARTIRHR
ncbi:MAG: hypothetical protein KY459_07795 [Acidobacteria bacterium]|nr:hypothetical protein [Acidobacteriota bacterium]